MTPASIPCRWTGEGFAPFGRWQQKCDAEFVVGEIYNMEEVTARSSASHRHFFASLNEAWKNLPDEMLEQFPTADHLRRYALIKTGYCDQRQFPAASKAEAVELAAFMRPFDQYAVVLVRENVVTVYTAHSQSWKAMGSKVFQQSKDSVLGYAASLIGVKPEDLGRNAREAA